MVRAGQSTERAQLVYQHSKRKHQQRIAHAMHRDVLRQRGGAAVRGRGEQTRATVHPLFADREAAGAQQEAAEEKQA